MNRFAALYDAIDATTSTNARVDALVRYFTDAPHADAAWAVAFLTGRRPKRLAKSADLRTWAAEAAGIPDWLFEESYAQAGDLAETIALLLPETTTGDHASEAAASDASNDESAPTSPPFAELVETRLLALRGLEPDAQRTLLLDTWRTLGGTARFVFNKLLTGAFRVGVSDGLVVRALARVAALPVDVIAHRLMGDWEPSAAWYARLVAPASDGEDWRRPYPFFLASPYDGDVARIGESLGDVRAWRAEWKWDGIRVQCVRRRGTTLLWSRGEELLAGRFPEVEEGAAFLPDGTVLDGELLAWDAAADRPQPFTALQRRINRRTVGRTLLRDVPCRVLVYDCLEFAGEDVRARPLEERRALAARIVHALPTGAPFALSPTVAGDSWSALAAARETARDQLAEGLMLKRADSAYGTGRRGGDWMKWKVVPHTVDAVLIYAQAGHGRRAGLYTDYSFAVWDGDALVPFAKAYSGLTDAEIREVDRFVRAHTEERFGPVRTVTPTLVFELAFEAIQRSTRHKSGIAVRFPRIARWRRDKGPQDANTLDDVRALLPAETA